MGGRLSVARSSGAEGPAIVRGRRLPASICANMPRPVFRFFSQANSTKPPKISATAGGGSAGIPTNGVKRHKAERPDRMLSKNEAGAMMRCKDVVHLSGSEDARASVECRESSNIGSAHRLATIFKPVDGKLRGKSSLIDDGTNHQ